MKITGHRARGTIAAVTISGALLLAGCAGGSSDPEEETTTPTPTAATETTQDTEQDSDDGQDQAVAPQSGYISLSAYESDPGAYADSDVVLFFNASWCPTCQEAVKNFTDASFPEGLVIVSVDYDDNTGLRQQYGVTTQHTYVQVAPDGSEITKFTGSTTPEQVAGLLA